MFLFTLPTHPFLAIKPFVQTTIDWDAQCLRLIKLELFLGYGLLFNLILLPDLEGPRTSWPGWWWGLGLSYGKVLGFLGNSGWPEGLWMGVGRLYSCSDHPIPLVYLAHLHRSLWDAPKSPVNTRQDSAQRGHLQDF